MNRECKFCVFDLKIHNYEGCGDNGSSRVTYFYADGTVAYNKCSRVINDIEADCSD